MKNEERYHAAGRTLKMAAGTRCRCRSEMIYQFVDKSNVRWLKPPKTGTEYARDEKLADDVE